MRIHEDKRKEDKTWDMEIYYFFKIQISHKYNILI